MSPWVYVELIEAGQDERQDLGFSTWEHNGLFSFLMVFLETRQDGMLLVGASIQRLPPGVKETFQQIRNIVTYKCSIGAHRALLDDV